MLPTELTLEQLAAALTQVQAQRGLTRQIDDGVGKGARIVALAERGGIVRCEQFPIGGRIADDDRLGHCQELVCLAGNHQIRLGAGAEMPAEADRRPGNIFSQLIVGHRRQQFQVAQAQLPRQRLNLRGRRSCPDNAEADWVVFA